MSFWHENGVTVAMQKHLSHEPVIFSPFLGMIIEEKLVHELVDFMNLWIYECKCQQKQKLLWGNNNILNVVTFH